MIVRPPSLVTGPLTVVWPPENVMLPLLSSPVPPVRKIPQPLMLAGVVQGVQVVVEDSAGCVDDARVGGEPG